MFSTKISAGFLLLLAAQAAHAFDPQMVTVNNMKLISCFSFDQKTGDPKPNSKDASCKVVSNIPGEKESSLTLDTTVNLGTIEKPKERATRLEVKIIKEKGKAVRFEQKITDPSNGKSDLTKFDVGPDGALKNGVTTQNGVSYGWMDKDRCKDLKQVVEAVGTKAISQCASLAQAAIEPITKIQEQLGKEKMRLGAASPAVDSPSMIEWRPIDTQKMGDVFSVLVSCGQSYALEKAKADALAAGAKKATGPVAPAVPATKPAPARQ